MCDNTYKTTFRLNLNKDRDYAIYSKIKDKENINEYLKDCIEKQAEPLEAVNGNIDMAALQNIIRHTLEETIKEYVPSLKKSEPESSYPVPSETVAQEGINVPDETIELQEEGLPDEALAFLDGLDNL